MKLPLTPASCDCRGLGFMPVDVQRLLDSDTFALATGDEFKAALTLWFRSWSQVPAGSIPSDPRLLARMASVPLAEWEALAPMALRGWVECEDGRLYHPVVAEKALQAWADRIGYRERSAKAQAARHESFVFQPEEFASLRREAAICLERLVPGSALAMGVVLQGDEKAPTGTDAAPTRNPPRNDFGSEEKGEDRKGQDSEGIGEETTLVEPSGPTPAEQAFALYLDLADELGLAKPRRLDRDRAAKLTLRLTENGGVEGWASILGLVRQSPHLQGRNDRGWRATFDWLLNPVNLRKVAEGNYLRDDSPAPGGGGYLALAMEGLAA